MERVSFAVAVKDNGSTKLFSFGNNYSVFWEVHRGNCFRLLVIVIVKVTFPFQTSLEIVLCTGLVKFLQFNLAQCGGKDVVTFYCIVRDLPLAVGSPPFICFLNPSLQQAEGHQEQAVPCHVGTKYSPWG